MTYDIKRTNGSVEWLVKTVHPTGTQSKKAMGESVVDMSFTLPVYVDFKINDFVVVYGETYKINLTPSVKKVGKRKFEYQIQFEHLFYDLAKVQLQFLNPQNQLLEPVFNLMGNAATIVGLIVDNANRHSPGWSVGVVDDTAYQNFSFNAENCLQVLNRLASDFETEFWIENKTIHLQKREQSSGLQFEYGQGKGLYSIYRSNKSNINILTRLYVRGGSRNLPADYRNYSTSLLLPNGATYIQDDAKVDPQTGYGLIESTIVFENIFPQREGTISAVVAGNDNWDKFTDNSIDFDVNAYKLATPAKVAFNTGQLAGYEFEISDYNHATKQFTIIQNTDEALTVPSNLIRPAVGDKYVLLDIKMPQTYVDAAEAKLLAAAQAYYNKNSDPSLNFAYSVDCDPIWFKQQNVNVVLGNTVVIYDVDLGINGEIRIAGYKRDLQTPSKYELEISDSIGASEIVRQYAQQQRTLQLIESSGLLDINQIRKNIFLNRLSESGGYLMLSGVKVKAGLADLALNANHADLADYALDADKWDGRQFSDFLNQPLRTTDDVRFKSITSTSFVSGAFGSGFKIDQNGDAVFDNLTVRKQFNVYELVLNKISGTNGALAVTDTVKIDGVTETPTGYDCTIDTAENTIAVPFQVNDLLRCQVWNGTGIKYYFAKVTAIGNGTFTIDKPSKVGAGVPASGDTVVRFGNVSNPNRQGLLYLTASDGNAPYLDVLDGVTSDNLAGKTKVRLGRLDGITDADLGQLEGYGIYADRAFIKGKIVVTGGNAATINNVADAKLEAINSATTQASADATIKASAAQVAAIQTAANDASTKISAIKIGGRNFLLKSNTANLLGGEMDNSILYMGKPTIKFVNQVTYSGAAVLVKPNTYYTFSALVRSSLTFNSGGVTPLYWHVRDEAETNNGLMDIIQLDEQLIANEWRLIYCTIFTASTAHHFVPYVYTAFFPNIQLNFAWFKFEEGNKPTDWVPAPEDVQAAIDLAKATADAANASYAALTANLKSLAYADVVELAKLGTTIIDNGKIKTTLIDADYIRANVVNAGYINTLEIDASAIKSGTIDSSRINAGQIVVAGGGATLSQAQAYANTAQANAISTASSDAQSKANAAQANAISVASNDAQAKADAAQAAANSLSQQLVAGIKIGGRNLLLNSNTASLLGGAIDNTILYNGKATMRFINPSAGSGHYVYLKPNVWYTYSALVYSSADYNSYSNLPLHFHVRDANETNNGSYATGYGDEQLLANKWKVIYYTFLTNDQSHHFVPYWYSYGMPAGQVNVAWFKFEEGTKPTDWMPAPEDVQTAIDLAKATADAANASYAALTANLKSLAYADVVELAKLGTTIIEGGKIKATLLDADYIRANIVNASYIAALDIVATKVAATQGFIGGFNIVNQSLIAGSNSDNPTAWDLNSSNIRLYTDFQLYRKIGGTADQTDEMAVNLGYYPATSGLSYKDTLVLKNNIRNTAQDYMPPSSLNGSGAIYRQKNRALILEAKNSDENIALEVMSGHVYLRGVNDAGTANALRNGYIKYVNMNGRQVLVLDSNPTELNTGIPDAQGLFWNDAQTGYAQKNDCYGYDPQYGYEVGSQHQYTVPAHTYSSTVSKAVANSQAATEAQNQAQYEADNFGYCYYQ